MTLADPVDRLADTAWVRPLQRWVASCAFAPDREATMNSRNGGVGIVGVIVIVLVILFLVGVIKL
jgi:hypothetical protein